MHRIRVDRSSEMEVIARVVATGSLSAAGRQLGLSPSAISRILTRVETRLGVRLLTRTTRALALTAEGEAYHRACLRVLAELEEAEREIAERGALQGRLRVNTSFPFGSRVLVPLLAEFLADHPGIVIDLSFVDSVVDLIAERTDVAIRVGPLPDSALAARKLGAFRRSVVASPGYLTAHGSPATPAALASHNCLDFNFRRSLAGWPFCSAGREWVQPISGNIEVSSGETLHQMAIAGLGITRLGSYLVADDIAAGRLVSLLDEFNPGDVEDVHVLFVGGANVPRRVRAFVDFLARRVKLAA
jgi:DNA-binding transcriptional LysR family regulator